MTLQKLPERPDLGHLKKLAKSLLHAAQGGEAAAWERFRALPALAKLSPAALAAADVALHDAQAVIAREHGFPSWRELREVVQEMTLTPQEVAAEFVRFATGQAPGRARRLLARFPEIAHDDLLCEVVLGDAAAVEARVREHPEAAVRPGGPQNWEPLQYLCQTSLPTAHGQRARLAQVLLAHGANPNAAYHWNWHPELPRTVLWGAVCTVHDLELAEVLLQSGARPTDGVTMHIAAGGGDLAALELLARHGADFNGIPGGVPPLPYMLGWSTNLAGARWLLEHGADANRTSGAQGDAAVHHAAARLGSDLMELLFQHGADIQKPRADGRTPLALAQLNGNDAVAQWLILHGAHDALSPLEQMVAACARGDRASAERLLRADPKLRSQLRPEHHLLLQVQAERGHVAALEAMLACGFDPNVKDGDGVTALHRAAMAGAPAAVAALLAHGASVTACDGMFAATPLVWAVEGWGHHKDAKNGDGFIEVARRLLAAGSPREWIAPAHAPQPEGTQEALAELCRLARI